ncbi:P-type ATPase 3 integral membrane protein [Cryptosporidium ubiquitum]|uniref:P-type ATPase 3 integral membrane protein n=1 Tax=Cryptosporidium ubiquitum TaxID=857276 RepID=A0A1J4MIS9_9CRYT|nr:P-type ATPase 3 integral membrane protein [Cryptosporidium ubiquitum]OII73919.1 P-type ATPase 3 integral membrane protein [Cryptosporidium ubiquitum]
MKLGTFGDKYSAFFPLHLSIDLLIFTISIFLLFYVVNLLLWRRYDKHIYKHQSFEMMLVPCRRNIYSSIFRFTLNFITALHLILIPLITYDSVVSPEGCSIVFWKMKAEVFLVEYVIALIICLGRKLFSRRIKLTLVIPSNLFDCNFVCVWIRDNSNNNSNNNNNNNNNFCNPNIIQSSSDAQYIHKDPKYSTLNQRVLDFYKRCSAFLYGEVDGFNYYDCQVNVDESSGIRYFVAGSTRFVFSMETGNFLPQIQSNKVPVSQIEKIMNIGGHSEASVMSYLSVFGNNESIFETEPAIVVIKRIFFCPTFILQYLMLSTTFFLRFFTWSFCWSALILYTNFFSFFKEILRNNKVLKETQTINNRPVKVKRGNIKKSIKASDIVLFDIILSDVGDIAPCDMILMEKLVLVDESSLTGEATPVLKKPLNLSKLSNSQILSTGDKILKDSLIYAGCKILKIFNADESNDSLKSIVLNTGIFTFKSRILHTASQNMISDDFHDDIPLLWLLTLFVASVIITVQCFISPFNIGSVFFILGTLMQLIPIWAPASVQSCINNSVSKLKSNSNIDSSFPRRILFASKLDALFFDKTGTLTKNEYVLDRVERLNSDLLESRGFFTGNGNYFGRIIKGVNEEKIDILKTATSTCHSLSFNPDNNNDEYYGDLIEKEMLNFTKSSIYERSSTDGRSLKRFIFERESEFGNENIDSNQKAANLEKMLNRGCEVLKIFDFSSISRSMSVIVRCNVSNKVFLFTKGASESILKCSIENQTFKDIELKTSELSLSGSYVLLIAYRELKSDPESIETYRLLNENRRFEFEVDLTPIGILCFSNCIRKEAPFIIKEIKELGIKPIILTGDNPDCALSVAKQVGIINGQLELSDFELESDRQFKIEIHGDQKVVICHAIAGKLVFLNESRHEVKLEQVIDNLNKIKLVVTYESYEMMSKVVLNNDGTSKYDEKQAMLNKRTLLDLLKDNISVISRANHINKQSVVKQFIEDGKTVGMVGDGSNDVAALKESNLGIFVNRTGILNSHFSLNEGDLNGILSIIQEGCGCAANSRSLYLFMIMYGFTLVICKNILLYIGQATLPTMGYFYYSIIVNFPSVWGIKRSRPAKKIKKYPVDSGLVTKKSVLTVVYFILIIGINLGIVLFLLSNKPWFVSSYKRNMAIPIYIFARQDGFESSTVFIWMCSLHSHMALIFGLGGYYREPFYKNKVLVFTWLFAQLGLIFLIFSEPNLLTCFFKINCIESITPGTLLSLNIPKFSGNNVFPLSWKFELVGWIAASFLACIYIYRRINFNSISKIKI